MEQFHQVDVVRLVAEMQLQELIYRGFEQNCIVDRDRADSWDAIIAWLPPPREGFVHKVIHDKEERLQLETTELF